MNKTQHVLIGNPLQLTTKGLIELHKLMNKETYLYKESFRIPKNLTRDEKLDYYLNKELVYSLVEEKEFLLEDEKACEYRIISSVYTESSSVDKLPVDNLLFYGDWLYPTDEKRNNPYLHQLFNTDYNKEYFVYENEPRVYTIPSDVRWYIDEDEMGVEYIHEKGRVWG